MFFFSIFLKYRIYRYSFEPSFERTLRPELSDFFENRHETIVQIIFRLGFIPGVFKTNTEQYSRISSVQLLLSLPIAFFTFMYEFFQTQIYWYWLGLLQRKICFGLIHGDFNLQKQWLAISVLTLPEFKEVRLVVNYLEKKAFL